MEQIVQNLWQLKMLKLKKENTITPREGEENFIIFPYVGLDPVTHIFDGKIELENGFIKTNENMETNIPGVVAAGDCRVNLKTSSNCCR